MHPHWRLQWQKEQMTFFFLQTEQQNPPRNPQIAFSTSHPLERQHSPPHTHLHQNILALPGEHIFEPVEGEVVGHANSRARGVTHMVRAVPLPVPTDTRTATGRTGWALGTGDEETVKVHRMLHCAAQPPGNLRTWSICSLWGLGLRGTSQLERTL